MLAVPLEVPKMSLTSSDSGAYNPFFELPQYANTSGTFSADSLDSYIDRNHGKEGSDDDTLFGGRKSVYKRGKGVGAHNPPVGSNIKSHSGEDNPSLNSVFPWSILLSIENCCSFSRLGKSASGQNGTSSVSKAIDAGLTGLNNMRETGIDVAYSQLKKLKDFTRASSDDSLADSDSSSMQADGGNQVIWDITLSSHKWPANATNQLSYTQSIWAALVWCVRMENSERPSQQMINEILMGAKLQNEGIDIGKMLKNAKEFSHLNFVKDAEGRNIYDVMTEYLKVVDASMSSHKGVYGIFAGSDMSAIAISLREHGEVQDASLLELPLSNLEKRDPSIKGFKSISAAEKYTVECFETGASKLQEKAVRYIEAWILTSRVAYEEDMTAGGVYKKQTNPELAQIKAAERAAALQDKERLEEEARKDIYSSTKKIYADMYEATSPNYREDENEYSLSKLNGMEIRDQQAIRRENILLENEEPLESRNTGSRNRKGRNPS